ncbi:MAG: hypothetical protein KC434_12060 [Anaerolineales bacterium]|nr:hypothetical protein [Anaerolineales bacterium]
MLISVGETGWVLVALGSGLAVASWVLVGWGMEEVGVGTAVSDPHPIKQINKASTKMLTLVLMIRHPF